MSAAGISNATYYAWTTKFRGLLVSDAKRLAELSLAAVAARGPDVDSGMVRGASHPVVFETMDATSAHAVVAFIGLLEDFRPD